MVTSIRAFNFGLFREHLDEASFLYEQRLAYLFDPEINWPDIVQWEDRLEAHLDALIVGGATALEVCREEASGDAGMLNATLRVLCRADRQHDAITVLKHLDCADSAKRRAAADALRREAPREWQSLFVRAIEQMPQLTPVLADVIGFRRFPLGDLLDTVLKDPSTPGRAQTAWALGRIGSTTSIEPLWVVFEEGDDVEREAAAVALARLGDDRVPEALMRWGESQEWARRVLGLCGGSKAVPMLLDFVVNRTPDVESILAIGLLGDLTAVAPLLHCLTNDAVNTAAAIALNTITGAQLFAQRFIADKFDPEELSQDEREAFENDGRMPMRSDGRPFGNWERRPVVDHTSWRRWLDDNKSRFSRDRRWRMGRPQGPGALSECLRCASTPCIVRGATYEEMVIRYDLDVPFEVDLHVPRQRRLLDRIDEWARRLGHLDAGHWYLHGQPQN